MAYLFVEDTIRPQSMAQNLQRKNEDKNEIKSNCNPNKINWIVSIYQFTLRIENKEWSHWKNENRQAASKQLNG